MLKPELQSMPDFVDGIENIAEAMKKSALMYLEDGSVEAAIPPLKAVLHVMAHGDYEGRSIHDPEVRALFDRDAVLASDWYKDRLARYRDGEADYIRRSIDYIRQYLADRAENGSLATRRAQGELTRARERLAALESGDYLSVIDGTIGRDPLFRGSGA